MNYKTSFVKDFKLDLSNEIKLLNSLSNPQEKLKFIHITGTNGKGSVCSFLECMLIKEGYKTGKFSSPEVLYDNESISFNGKMISDEDLFRITSYVEEVAKKEFENSNEFPSSFEIMVAVSFLYFIEKKCDYVILEVGMGGLNDATNVISKNELAIITSISLDHSSYLGSSVIDIAKDKCGIIKENSNVITTSKNEEVMDIIKEKCIKTNSTLNICKGLNSVGFDEIYEKIIVYNKTVKLSLGGIFQVENASLALMAGHLLNLSKDSIIYGLENATNKARFEKFSDKLYFDGAHNFSGISSLYENIKRYLPNEDITFIFGTMKDKDYVSSVNILKEISNKFIFVNANLSNRSEKPENILNNTKHLNIDAKCCSIKNALKQKGTLIVCGSLYLYKAFYKEVLRGIYFKINNENKNKEINSIPDIEKYKTIFCYVSFNNEISTIKLINEMLSIGKTIVVPKCTDKFGNMICVEIKSLNDLKAGLFNIPEPTCNAEFDKSNIDLAIIPGIAFDKNGYRLGYGMGCYDKFLKDTKCRKIGICKKECFLPSIPHFEEDIKCDEIIIVE